MNFHVNITIDPERKARVRVGGPRYIDARLAQDTARGLVDRMLVTAGRPPVRRLRRIVTVNLGDDMHEHIFVGVHDD